VAIVVPNMYGHFLAELLESVHNQANSRNIEVFGNVLWLSEKFPLQISLEESLLLQDLDSE
jgi:hypothetical protein